MFYQVAVPILSELQRFSPATNIGAFTSNIIGFMFIIAALAAFVYFVLGGLQWIVAGSDKDKVESAKNRITNAIIGLGIVAVSWAIFLLLNHFFGLNLAGGEADTSLPSGSSPSGNNGNSSQTCATGVPIGETANDGGAGRYCTDNGSAIVECHGPDDHFSYLHFDPCFCISGSPKPGYDFSSC